jgi:hypothetical protein
MRARVGGHLGAYDSVNQGRSCSAAVSAECEHGEDYKVSRGVTTTQKKKEKQRIAQSTADRA